MGRECPHRDCSPAYFKVKPGTGITSGQDRAFCPYCGTAAAPSDFLTQAQIVRSGEIEGREVRVTAEEVLEAIGIAESVLKGVCDQLFLAREGDTS